MASHDDIDPADKDVLHEMAVEAEVSLANLAGELNQVAGALMKQRQDWIVAQTRINEGTISMHLLEVLLKESEDLVKERFDELDRMKSALMPRRGCVIV